MSGVEVMREKSDTGQVMGGERSGLAESTEGSH